MDYLKIENPGVAPVEAFTLLGASTSRYESDDGLTIGQFGSGSKHSIAVCLRHRVQPVVFAGTLKLEFGTKKEGMGKQMFDRVVVKYGGKDQTTGQTRSSTEDLGFVVDYGSRDWGHINMALREFVSNSLDRTIQESRESFLNQFPREDRKTALELFKKKALDFSRVTVELVDESQVRAKADYTRVFVPATEDVIAFYENIDKWFLHFSDNPNAVRQTILPKAKRNIYNENKTAMIYRRGVLVREVDSPDLPSLFDYNLESLKLDECRNVGDYAVMEIAAKTLGVADEQFLEEFFKSFQSDTKYWEHQFDSYSLKDDATEKTSEVWKAAFDKAYGNDTVIATRHSGEIAARKGYVVVNAPEAIVSTCDSFGVRTPRSVLSADALQGREIYDTLPAVENEIKRLWKICVKHGMTNGKEIPASKTFRKIMEGGGQTLGYYKDETIYINQDIITGDGDSQQFKATVLEELCHHCSGAVDFVRDFQDWLLNMCVYLMK